MNIQEDVSLANHSTMRLGGTAKWLVELHNEEDIPEAVDWAKKQSLPIMVIGDGSNIVWRDQGFGGLIIVNKIRGRQILSEDTENTTLRIKAGENWDQAVAWTVEQNLSGIEFLSLIPGTVGAAPVQNIGAYGGELTNTLIEVEVFDTKTHAFGSIERDFCDFSYRNSRFKSKDKGRFIITGIVLKLNKTQPSPPFYESLEKYFEQHDIREYTPQIIRQAVIAIRSSKLPDPKIVANNGSFFTNPFVGQEKFDELKKQYPEIKGWPQHQKLDAPQSDHRLLHSGFGVGQAHHEGMVKLSAGWLVEHAGFRGIHDQQTGMATWQPQALVLVNEHAKSTADLLAFKQKIVDKVQEMFGVTLEQEPELLP